MSFLEVVAIGRQLNNTWIVGNVSFSQAKLQNIAIAGETGSGKSTLLKIVAGLVQPHTGQVLFEGTRVEGPAEKLIPGHPGIAYLSQVFELPKFLRVEQVLQYASKLPVSEAQQLYEICHITHLLKRRTDELSGGEQQRIALARLLAMRPKLLLLDEPFSNLDLIHKNLLKVVLSDAQQQLQLSCILTSHDPQDTLTWADAIGIMKEGKMVQWGTPEQVYRQPCNEYVAGLLGKFNVLCKTVTAALLSDTNYENDSRLLVRPEDFCIRSVVGNGVLALVAATRFAGNFYETDIWIEEQLLTIQTNKGGYKKGDRIYVSLKPDAVWQVKD